MILWFRWSGFGSERHDYHALTVNIVIKLHEGAVRFGDERLKQLRGANGRPRSLASKYEAESVEQANLRSMCQAALLIGMKNTSAYMPDKR